MIGTTVQMQLGKKFNEMPDDFRRTAHSYFYKIIPLLTKEFKPIKTFGCETSLEAFEELIEEGGVKLSKDENEQWRVILFNLVTQKYEDITFLNEEFLSKEVSDENSGYQET